MNLTAQEARLLGSLLTRFLVRNQYPMGYDGSTYCGCCHRFKVEAVGHAEPCDVALAQALLERLTPHEGCDDGD